MRIAHISDLHVLDFTGVKPSQFVSKRLIGGFNLLLGRAKSYNSFNLLERLIEDIRRQDPCHIAITGDISNLALDCEFEKAASLIKLLGGRDRVSLVPGNHDYYTAGSIRSRRFEKWFHSYMFERYSDSDLGVYPFIKDLGPVVLMGINSACSTIPPLAYGLVSQEQLCRAEDLLSRMDMTDKSLVVMLHHALHTMSPKKQFTDRLIGKERFMRFLASNKAILAIYGHDHAGYHGQFTRQGNTVRLLCCGSSTRYSEDPARMARYRIIRIENKKIQSVETRVFNMDERRFLRMTEPQDTFRSQ